MKRILIMVFALVALVSVNIWAQGTAPKKSTKSATSTSAKAMNMAGTISSDGKTFTADKNSNTWTVENPDAVKGHEGQHVSINANEDAAKGEVRVNSVKLLGKAKGTTPAKTY